MKASKNIATVDHHIIRYANCWEDAGVLLKGLSPPQGARILSIASAGDNSFSLLTCHPEQVLAVDINQAQLFVTELKKQAIKYLAYEEVLEFLGFRPCDNRLAYFNRIKKELSGPCRKFWESHEYAMIHGLIFQGKFERYFRFFVHNVVSFIHRKQTVQQLFDAKNEAEQEMFYAKKWNTWRWKLLFRIFFSRTVMGRYGRDKKFFTEVGGDVAKTIYKRAGNHLKSSRVFQNELLRFTLTGDFHPLLPHYLQADHFKTVQQNIDRLTLKKGYIEEIADENDRFDAMNLSNIFEYMNMEEFKAVTQKILHYTNPGSRMAYWNLLVPRRISQIFDREVQYEKQLSETLSQQDKGFFYKQIIIDKKT